MAGFDPAELLAWRRRMLEMTQAAIAREAGTNQATISRLEGGRRDVRLGTLLEVVRALGMDLRIVPREVIPAVDHLISSVVSIDGTKSGGDRPLYTLDEDGDDEDK